MDATGTREHTTIIDPNDRESMEQTTAAEQWEGSHLPILILGILGVGGLATVMAGIFILAPLLDRI